MKIESSKLKQYAIVGWCLSKCICFGGPCCLDMCKYSIMSKWGEPKHETSIDDYFLAKGLFNYKEIYLGLW